MSPGSTIELVLKEIGHRRAPSSRECLVAARPDEPQTGGIDAVHGDEQPGAEVGDRLRDQGEADVRLFFPVIGRSS